MKPSLLSSISKGSPFQIAAKTAVAFGLLLILISGCATAPKKVPESQSKPEVTAPSAPAETMGPPEPFGPNPAEVQGPQPDVVRSVVLVLGPGLAPGFAHVGAIRALNENHIPIAAVLGAETGALVGGLYANSKSINRFEFRLLRFKDDLFTPKTGLFSSLDNRVEKYNSELKNVFGTKDLSDLKIPTWVALSFAGSNAPVLVQKGLAANAIAAATANPAIFPGAPWENSEAHSSPQALPQLIQEARALNRGVVVVVNVDGAGMGSDPGDVLITPNLQGIGPSDFSRMTEAAFRGKAATEEKISQIKHLVGIDSL